MIRNPGNTRQLEATEIAPDTLLDKHGIVRASDGTFKKGISGNPGGRKKCFDLITNIASENLKGAAETILEVMYNPSEQGTVRLKAAEWVVKWAAGVPIEEVPVEGAPAITGEYSAIGQKLCEEIINKHKQALQPVEVAEEAVIVQQDKAEGKEKE